MRVALTHPYSWPEVRRGGERILAETARSLTTRGHDVTVLTAGAARGRIVGEGVRTVRFARRWRRADLHERWFAAQLVPVLTVRRFDVVHSLMPRDCVAAIATARVAGHRTVYQDLGIPWPDWVAAMPDRRARRRVTARVDVYAAISRFALDVVEREWSRRGALLSPGVRLSEFKPAPTREPRPTVLFSAAFDEPRKGLAVVLEAVALASRSEPGLRLWLTGPGDPRPLLARAPVEARERTEVLPLGEPGDQAARYGRAWLTVHAAKHESFGMVVVESLACGTPVVAADHSALPELVTAETGVLCDPDSVGSVADSLLAGLDLARNPETTERCRASAAGYDWDTSVIPRLERLYAGETP